MSGKPSIPEPVATNTIFDKSVSGRRASSVPPSQEGTAADIPPHLRRSTPSGLPEVSERDLVQHYTTLSQKNWAIDVGAYPLGSCTMKYNPKINEEVAALPGFSALHPWQSEEDTQGALRLMWELERALCEITGMARATLQPSAGAQGELTGLLIMRAFHTASGDPRQTVLIPDSAHGTNPASVRLAGYKVRQIPSDSRGLVDVDGLRKAADETTVGLMLTNPNTLGLFERDIVEIAKIMHSVGGLLYFDGANLNAIMGEVRPGDMGFDIVHMNLHKTFSTPHGGGGPGAGPVAVSPRLERFLPAPLIAYDEKSDRYYWEDNRPDSIGRIHGFHGNFGILVRAFAYYRANGGPGLKRVSDMAVLNANYLRARIQDVYPLEHPGTCMHEFVSTAKPFKKVGIRAMDVAKRLIDFGFHPPTVYFPLVVEEALMIEPTETESKQTIDALADALLQIAIEAREKPDLLLAAPTTTPVGRLDEARAARHLQLRWQPSG